MEALEEADRRAPLPAGWSPKAEATWLDLLGAVELVSFAARRPPARHRRH